MDEYTISVQGTVGQEAIRVLQRSTGAEQFIAWHGITAVNRFWLWDALWPHGEVQLVGLPGHGAVPNQPNQQWSRWTQEHLIETGIASLKKLNNGKPATIIGHSTGGLIALGIAHRAPELVKRLIVLSPVVWSELTGIVNVWQRFVGQPSLLKAIIHSSLGLGRCSHWAFSKSLVAFIKDRQGFYSNPKVVKTIRDGYEQMQQTPIAGIAGITTVLKQADIRPLIMAKPTTVPTLIVHGQHDPIVPFKQAQWLKLNIPHADLLAIPHVGHLPYAEQEAYVNKEVTNWVEKTA